jgi:uncharacterized membrane protein YccC
MKTDRFVYIAAFVLRCSGSATLGYVLAQWVGLPYPLWTSISAVVVSQERLAETKSAVLHRILGTTLGVCSAIILHGLSGPLGLDMAVQIALSVALCACFACGHPSFRAAMFTCPIVLLTALPAQPMFMVGFYRGSEVILGGLIANALHIVAERILALLNHPEQRHVERRVSLHGE